MTAIRPFRLAIVYPALMRQIERGWREVADEVIPTRDRIDRLGEGLA